MKKFLSVFLTAALAVSMLAGCGSKNETVTAKVIDIDLTNEEYAFGVDKNQPELLEKTNEFIAKIKSDGTLDEIIKKWTGESQSSSNSAVPETTTPAGQKATPKKSKYVISSDSSFAPFVFQNGKNKYTGIDMDLIKAIAKDQGSVSYTHLTLPTKLEV